MNLMHAVMLVSALAASCARQRQDATFLGPELGRSTKSAGADPSRPHPESGDTVSISVPVRGELLRGTPVPQAAPPASNSGSTPVSQPPDLAPTQPAPSGGVVAPVFVPATPTTSTPAPPPTTAPNQPAPPPAAAPNQPAPPPASAPNQPGPPPASAPPQPAPPRS
jgi:hypothetical protein